MFQPDRFTGRPLVSYQETPTTPARLTATAGRNARWGVGLVGLVGVSGVFRSATVAAGSLSGVGLDHEAPRSPERVKMTREPSPGGSSGQTT